MLVDQLYDQVPYLNQHQHVPDDSLSRSYAVRNEREYFATSAQAYYLYGTTPHSPWDRESLYAHDLELAT